MLCTRPSTSSVPKWLSCSCIRTGASRGYSAEARPQGRLAKQTISKPASSWPVAEQCRRQYSSRYDARIWSTIADTVGTRLRKEMDDEDLLELLDTSQLSRSQDARLRLQARFKIMTTLFVGHIHSWATHAELKDIFDRFGPNKISWKVLTNGQNSTFAVVGFQSNAALRACVRAFLRNRELFRIRDYPMLLDFTTEDRQHPAVVMTNQIRVGGFQEPVSDEVIKSVFGKFGQIISIARPSHDVDEGPETVGTSKEPQKLIPAENDWVDITYSTIPEVQATLEAQERARLEVQGTRVWVASRMDSDIPIFNFKREKKPTDTLYVGRFAVKAGEDPSASELARAMRLTEEVKLIKFSRSRDSAYSYARVICHSVEQAQKLFDAHKKKAYIWDGKPLLVDWAYHAPPREPSCVLCIPGFEGDAKKLKDGFGRLAQHIVHVDTPKGRVQWSAYVQFDSVEHAEEAMEELKVTPFHNARGDILRPVYAVARGAWEARPGLKEASEEKSRLAYANEQFGLRGSNARTRNRSIVYGSDWGGSQTSPDWLMNRGFQSARRR